MNPRPRVRRNAWARLLDRLIGQVTIGHVVTLTVSIATALGTGQCNRNQMLEETERVELAAEAEVDTVIATLRGLTGSVKDLKQRVEKLEKGRTRRVTVRRAVQQQRREQANPVGNVWKWMTSPFRGRQPREGTR